MRLILIFTESQASICNHCWKVWPFLIFSTNIYIYISGTIETRWIPCQSYFTCSSSRDTTPPLSDSKSCAWSVSLIASDKPTARKSRTLTWPTMHEHQWISTLKDIPSFSNRHFRAPWNPNTHAPKQISWKTSRSKRKASLSFFYYLEASLNHGRRRSQSQVVEKEGIDLAYYYGGKTNKQTNKTKTNKQTNKNVRICQW